MVQQPREDADDTLARIESEGLAFPTQFSVGTESDMSNLRNPFPSDSIPPSEEKENKQEEKQELSPQDKLDRETAWHHLDNPIKPITPRHWELCRLLSLGNPHWKISEMLGYSPYYISVLSCHPKIRAEVGRLQSVVFERTIEDRFKQMNHRAMDVVEEVIDGKDVDVKMQDRLRAATWLLEKTTGKAKQEIETKGGGLADFMTLLRQAADENKMRTEQPGLPEGEARGLGNLIDVTPEKKEKDPIESWVDANT
jgi:hypothetical protein